MSSWRAETAHAGIAVGAIGLVTAAYVVWLHVTDATSAALTYVLVLLVVAAQSPLWVSLVASVVAALAFDFFFLPPVGTFNIDDSEDWVAFIAFVAVIGVVTRLSSLARGRQREQERLFQFSRDVLADSGSSLMSLLPGKIAEHFRLDYVALSLFEAGEIRRWESGAVRADHQADMRLKRGGDTLGTLIVTGRRLEPATLNALASVVSIAIERARLLEQRHASEVERRSVEIKSALLASLSHDLRTPLTAMAAAISNLGANSLSELQRDRQAQVAREALDRLVRLFENLLEMARLDAGAIAPTMQWVHPGELVEAARSQADLALRRHRVAVVDGVGDMMIRTDPKLVSTSLAHLLENAAQYSPHSSTIAVTLDIVSGGMSLHVDDEGVGIDSDDLPRIFDRFFRGSRAERHRSGTGMGLAIVRGLMDTLGGRVTVEPREERGSRFSLFVPGDVRASSIEEVPLDS